MSTHQDGRPLVFAHRGASADVAEHTLAAYERALDDGADGLECDVRLTADGVLVCVHDRRVDRTSNGRGAVSTLELADLAQLDFQSWRPGDDDEAPDVVNHGSGSVLTLERLLELVRDTARPVALAIETKHPTRYAGLVEQRLFEVLDRFGLARPRLGDATDVRVMSFSPVGLRRMRKLAPSLPRVLLMDRVPVRLRDGSLPPGIHVAGPSIEVVRAHPRYAQKVRAKGHRVYCWTVDEPDDVDRCVAAGVDAILTNRPRAVLDRLAAR